MCSRLRARWRRTVGLFRHAQTDARFREEWQAHVELLAEEYVQRGFAPDAARDAARRTLGGREPVRERYRDQSGVPWIETVMRDVRYTLRSLRRAPVFTAVAVGTLALGIGANTAIFQLLDAVRFRTCR